MNVSLIKMLLGQAAPAEPFEVLSRAILAAAGKSIGSKGQKAELVKLQEQYDQAERVIAAHCGGAAKNAWLEHLKDLEKAVANGDIATVDGYSRAEFESEMESKMEAGKRARAAVTAACAPLAKELSEEFASIAETFSGQQAKAEAEAYARFGVEYPGPSRLVQALRQAADWARGRVPRSAGSSRPPRGMVPYVDF